MNISSSSKYNPNINEFNISLFFSEKSEEKIDMPSENSSSSPLENQTNISNISEKLNADAKAEQKAYEETFDNLEKAFESLQEDVKNGKKLEDIVAVDKLIPYLEDIAKYSSKGLKYMGKGLNFAIDNLPCDRNEQFEKLIEKFVEKFGNFTKNYAQLAKVFKATLFVVKYSQTKKLEALLREKTTELRKCKEWKTQLSKLSQLDKDDRLLENKLTQEIEKYEKEITEINELLQVQLKKLQDKFINFGLSGSIALLKLVKATSSPATKKFLTYLIWCLSMIFAVLGTYKGISDTWKTVGIWRAEYRQLNHLKEEVRQLEFVKKELTQKNDPDLVKYCEKTMTVCKARICFLEKVRMKETRNKLGIEILETICALSSTLGTLGALFAVTTVMAGALSTFAGWITILCCLISIITYLSENRIKFRATAEEKSRNQQDQLLAEIIQLRLQTKAVNLERIDNIKELESEEIIKLINEHGLLCYEYNKNKQAIQELEQKLDPLLNPLLEKRRKLLLKIEKIDENLSKKIHEYNSVYKTDLCEPPKVEEGVEKNPPEEFQNHSFIYNVQIEEKILQKLDIEKLKNEKKQLLAQQIELGGSADDYDKWANEMMEDMKDPLYRQKIGSLLSEMHFKPGTTILIKEDALEAFKQIENFIRA